MFVHFYFLRWCHFSWVQDFFVCQHLLFWRSVIVYDSHSQSCSLHPRRQMKKVWYLSNTRRQSWYIYNFLMSHFCLEEKACHLAIAGICDFTNGSLSSAVDTKASVPAHTLWISYRKDGRWILAENQELVTERSRRIVRKAGTCCSLQQAWSRQCYA